jgi:hypothetical protein
MPVYSASSTQWPLLQSKTEQKFKSGLFTVSAEFIRPVGNTELPTEIKTSIGEVEVWPEPCVSSATDGFERINATGYGVWDAGSFEIVNGRAASSFNLTVHLMDLKENRDQNGGLLPSSLTRDDHISSKQYVIVENVYIKKIGIAPPTDIPVLKVLTPSGEDITNKIFNVNELASTEGYDFVGGDSVANIAKRGQFLSQTKINNYGNIVESEWTYEILLDDVSFGTFLKSIPFT